MSKVHNIQKSAVVVDLLKALLPSYLIYNQDQKAPESDKDKVEA